VRDERTRDEAAKATERAKPVIEVTGRKRGSCSSGADEARAAAEGVREGWNKTPNGSVDLNSAAQRQLLDLGISRPQAHEIITHRPYRDPHDLVTKGILSREEYVKIRDRVTVK
jgi:DNA uptake protein ComE-like DNA-binding protein